MVFYLGCAITFTPHIVPTGFPLLNKLTFSMHTTASFLERSKAGLAKHLAHALWERALREICGKTSQPVPDARDFGNLPGG